MNFISTKHEIDLEVGILPALELRFAGNAEGELSGYASTFGGRPDSYGDVVAAGAFHASLAAHKSDGTAPVMLWSHDPSKVIGRWVELREDDRGLFVRGTLNLATQLGRETHALVKAGDVSGMSIGYRVRDFERGRAGAEAARTLKAVDLVEISIVSIPANGRSRISGVKSLTSKADLVDLLRNAGIPKAAAQKLAAGGWPALDTSDETDTGSLMGRILSATRELKSLKG